MSVWRKRFENGDNELRKTDNKRLNDKTDFEAWNILFSDFVKNNCFKNELIGFY